MSQYWEYKIEWVKAKRFNEKTLNKFGKEGWELVEREPYYSTSDSTLTSHRLILKRLRAR